MKRVELKRIAEFLWKGSPPDEKTPFAQSGSKSKNYETDDNIKPEKECPKDEGGKIEGPMSIPRKLCFVMSFNVWILYFLVLAWFIPCRNLNCDVEYVWETNLTSISPLTSLETMNVEGLPSLAMLGYADGPSYNLVAMRSDDGTFEWNSNLTFNPRRIQCNFEIIFDANRDGIPDCLLTGNNEMYAFNASNGHVLWQRNFSSDDGNIVSRFHPTIERDNLTYLIGTCGDKMVVLDASNGTGVSEVSLPCWSPIDIRIIPNVINDNFTFWSMVCDNGDTVEAWGFTEKDVLSRKNLKNTGHVFTLLFSIESYFGGSIGLGCDVTPIPGGPLLFSWSDRVVMVTQNATVWERHFPYPLTVASIKFGHFISAKEMHIAAAVVNGTDSIIYILERENGTTVNSVVLRDRQARSFEKVVGDGKDSLVLQSVYLNYTSFSWNNLTDPIPMDKTNFALIEITEKAIDVKNIVTTAGITSSAINTKTDGEVDLLLMKTEDGQTFYQKYVLHRSKTEDGLCFGASHKTHFSSEM